MFEFQLEIGKSWQRKFKSLWLRAGALSKWKAWEVQAYRHSGLLFIELNIGGWGWRPGPSLTLGILGYHVTACIHDIRHWDYSLNKFIDVIDGTNT